MIREYTDPYIDEETCRRVCEAAARKRAKQLGKPYPIPYTKIMGETPANPHAGDTRYLTPPVELRDGGWVMELTDVIKALPDGDETVDGEVVTVPRTGTVLGADTFKIAAEPEAVTR